MPTARTTVLVGVVGVAALAGCTPHQRHGDVVITSSMSRSGGTETHYAECASSTLADTGNYRIAVPEQTANQVTEGQPCPAGRAEPMPADEHRELYRQMSDALARPAPFAGGDIRTCGEWEADDPADARAMAAECPPLTKGDLP